MLVKVKLGSMIRAKNIVSVAESAACQVDLRCDRYTVNAKSMLGLFSLPHAEVGELHFHTEEKEECARMMKRLAELGLLLETETLAEAERFDITAFGEVLIDFTCQGYNEKGQKIFVQNPGGAPANVLVAASHLGGKTAFLGKAGNDMHGRYLKTVLRDEDVNVEGFRLDDAFFTTLAFVDLDEDGERTFSFARKPGADTQMLREEIDMKILANSYIFHVGSLSLTEEPSRATTFYAVNEAKKNGSILSYDPNYRASLWPDESTAIEHMRSLIPFANVMKVADTETELLTGQTDPEAAAQALCDQGVSIAVVTLGKEGAYVRTQHGGKMVPGFPSKVVDTTGAGDAFWGGFLYRLSQSRKALDQYDLQEIVEYVRFANAVASLCVSGEGAIPAMPQAESVFSKLMGI